MAYGIAHSRLSLLAVAQGRGRLPTCAVTTKTGQAEENGLSALGVPGKTLVDACVGRGLRSPVAGQRIG